MKTIRQYLAWLTPSQRKRFARFAGTSTTHLTNLAHGHSHCGTDLAARLERASWRLVEEPGTPDVLHRRDLNETCRKCPHAKR